MPFPDLLSSLLCILNFPDPEVLQQSSWPHLPLQNTSAIIQPLFFMRLCFIALENYTDLLPAVVLTVPSAAKLSSVSLNPRATYQCVWVTNSETLKDRGTSSSMSPSVWNSSEAT